MRLLKLLTLWPPFGVVVVSNGAILEIDGALFDTIFIYGVLFDAISIDGATDGSVSINGRIY